MDLWPIHLNLEFSQFKVHTFGRLSGSNSKTKLEFTVCLNKASRSEFFNFLWPEAYLGLLAPTYNDRPP
jgi:hypothetical protein